MSKRRTNKEYIEELKMKCPSMIPLEEFKGTKIPILHKCTNCNIIYKCKPKDKLEGHKCKYCNKGGNPYGYSVPKDKPATVYLVYIEKFDIYKIGITSKSVLERMKDNKISKYELILERYFNLGSEAVKLEKLWLSNIHYLKVNTGLLCTGNTETFRI